MDCSTALACAPVPDIRKRPGSEPIPGYRLLEPIGSGGFGEVWKCEAPGGLLKAIKFVYGGLSALEGANAAAEDELKAIQRVKAIRHPFLLSMERVECIAGELVIVLELADESLHDVLTAQREAGRDGLERDDLLGYMLETAEALDLMNIQHGLQHLDIKPRNLFLVSNHVKVGDFGLVNSMRLGDSSPAPALQLGGITPLYASPELFRGAISHASDQYSLALVYHELLTGMLPFDGANSRQLLLQHLTAKPDLSLLPDADRLVVARALAKDPQERFPSCTELVRALRGGPTTAARPDARPVSYATAANGLAGDRAEPRGEAVDSTETPTRARAGTNTVPARTGASTKGETVAGHRLLKCIQATPHTEVWKARSPSGAHRLVKCVFGMNPAGGHDQTSAAARLEQIQHPALLAAEVLQNTPGRLVLATDPVETTLRDHFQDCLAQGLTGIPRDELLGLLLPVAEALTDLQEEHGIQHLALNPRNLLLVDERVLIADFGLAQLLWLPAGQPLCRLNPRHFAPEHVQSRVHPSSDQCSLALIYHEMLTGSAVPRHAAPGNSSGTAADLLASLERLPATDREIIACALDPSPQRRWPSCAEMIRALVAAGADRTLEKLEKGTSCIKTTETTSSAAPASDALQAALSVPLPLGIIRIRLEAFRSQWNGEVIHDDDTRFAFHMKSPRSLWQRWLGRSPGLEVHVQLTYAGSSPPAGADVVVEIRPHDCGRKQSDELLKVIGPLLLQSARSYLQVNPKRRVHERFAWAHPLQACPIREDGTTGEPLECRGKDISLNGIGFYLPRELGTSHARLHLPRTPQTPDMSIPVRIVRLRDCGDGWLEAGAVLLSSEIPSPGNQTEEA